MAINWQKIGRRIKTLRAERGLVQVELAAKSGISQTTLATIEAGGVTRLETLDAIADVFGVKYYTMIAEAEALDDAIFEVSP